MPSLADQFRGFRWAAVAGLAVPVLLGASAVFAFDPNRYPFYPICFFHKATGLFCPGCGALRAMHQLLHGHLGAALRLNALLVFSLPVLGWLAVRLCLARFQIEPLLLSVRPGWLWAALIVSLLFGILRNLPFAPLSWLTP